ncbi:CerR family C-terminal domain-containing protein [Phenylobacterium sp.]|uniref:CerR family C-terminal domain-containing protein n=1 Tax=Phenylobacterium sp. TaxID=1871053 RepID=UPI0011FFD45D|nr:CerR family C-terminal domain-containing protein [Phenylobacterium sp.]THD58944.1 MAG: DUF1956 domain-containing protein [Phenylobacterium sp.]
MDGSHVPGPRRRPPEGGYARGAETRDRIIEAAYVVFAEEGYLGASTRRIAAEAGVNPPALQYYFDSKEGLHKACAEAVVAHVAGQLSEATQAAQAALDAPDRAGAAPALADLVVRLAEVAMAEAETEAWSHFLNRCQADDSGPAFEIIEAGISAPFKSLVIGLVAKTLGLPAADEEARLRGILLMSQLNAFHTHREKLLALLGWEDFAGERAAEAMAVLRDHVYRLTAPRGA